MGGDLSGDRRFLSGFNPDWKRPILTVETELLYFSLITLSTVGYGDIVPLSGTFYTNLNGAGRGDGVLYIATTVAVLVGRFRNESWE